MTKQSPNYHSSDLVTVLSLNYHSAIQTQTQMLTEPETYRMHIAFSFLHQNFGGGRDL